MNEQATNPETRGRHERLSVSGSLVFLWLGALLALVVAALLLTYGLFAWLGGEERAGPAQLPERPGTPTIAAPLEPSQRKQRLRYEARQRELLESYGWVSRQDEIAHIPLQRAIKLYVQRQGQDDESK